MEEKKKKAVFYQLNESDASEYEVAKSLAENESKLKMSARDFSLFLVRTYMEKLEKSKK